MNRAMARRLGAEFLGTAALLSAIVGSGIMGERPQPDEYIYRHPSC